MRILVTGANGYIGQGVVKELLNRGVEVIANDHNCEFIDKRAKVVTGNLFAVEDPYQYFEEPDVVLHLAWRDGFKHDSLNHILDLPCHFNFLREMADAGVKRICVMGSVHEVGYHEGCVDDKTGTEPLSFYGIAKNSLRQALEVELRNKQTLLQWIRGYYIVGNVEYGCSIFSKIARAAEQGEKEFPFTSGQNKFDFLDYDEFCEQVAAVVMQERELGIINCCSGNPQKLADRVEQFIREHNYDIKLLYNTFPDRPYDSKEIWGSAERIERIMGNRQ